MIALGFTDDRMTLKINWKQIFILIPLVLVFVSEMLLISYANIAGPIKLLAVLYMIMYSLIINEFPKKFIIILVLLLPFFLFNIFQSFNIKAAMQDGIRYFFPIVALLYGYSIKKNFWFIFKCFIIFVLINDLWQIINYFNWGRGVTQWFYYYAPDGVTRYFNASSGIIRATGIVTFFGLFGFINLISFFLVQSFYTGKRKNILLFIFVVSIFLSFSYKTIGTLLFILAIRLKNIVRITVLIISVLCIAIITFPQILLSMFSSIELRLRQYVFEGDSARAESYRVMYKELTELNLFGNGIGSFGGPASVTYESPFYNEVHFNWYSTIFLKTTDTFYPHVFVELGLIGATLYLCILLTPFFRRLWKKEVLIIICIIYFSLFFDAIFSFSLNNMAFVITSLIFIYPIIYEFQIKKNIPQDIKQ